MNPIRPKQQRIVLEALKKDGWYVVEEFPAALRVIVRKEPGYFKTIYKTGKVVDGRKEP